MPPDAVRSRSGCSTCRKRRKKCDETWDAATHLGTCNRCFVGSFECDRSPQPRQSAKPREARPTSSSAPSPRAFVPTSYTDAASPHHHAHHQPFASTSTSTAAHPPHPYPELEGEPFLSNFFESLDEIAFFPERPEHPYDETAAAGALVGLPAALAREEATPRSSYGSGSSPSSPLPGGNDENVPSPLYNTFNDGFLRSIPNPLRKVLTKRVDDVVAQHELTRTASLSVVLLYRARSLPNASEARAKLIQQSDESFHTALQHLQVPIPLEAQLVAVLDLQFHQFDLYGAAASHAVLLLGEFFVKGSMGTSPSLDFAALVDASTMPLRCFAYSEILTTVCFKNRRTIFRIAGLPGEASPSPLEDGRPSGDARLDTHLGLPVGLLLCLAAVSNLGIDMYTMDPDLVKDQRDRIERAIRFWQPRRARSGSLETADSVSWLEEVRTTEMWRHAALLHLFSTVDRLGPHAPPVRHSLTQIISLGDRPVPSSSSHEPSSLCGSFLACPYVLAGMVATAPGDREKVRKGLVECGPQKGYVDNLEACERVWAAVDDAGWTVDWKTVLEKEGKVVAFL